MHEKHSEQVDNAQHKYTRTLTEKVYIRSSASMKCDELEHCLIDKSVRQKFERAEEIKKKIQDLFMYTRYL